MAILHRNRMMLMNHALCRMLDGSEAELLAQGSFIDLVCEEDRDMMRAHADHIAHEPEGGKALVAFRIRTLQGRRIWVEGNTVEVEWQGWPATLSFIHDVTERRCLEENLKQTLAERETILDRSIVGIAFLDPKGMRNFTETFNNPKVQFFRRIKELQVSLKREDIRLESFLLSQTYRHDLRWPSPSSPNSQATAGDYRSHHILCAKDEPNTYVKELIRMLQSV